jgi:hypothetical protein
LKNEGKEEKPQRNPGLLRMIDAYICNCSETQFQLLPCLPLELGAGIIAGTVGNQNRYSLFAMSAAGEAETIGFRLLFHRAIHCPNRLGRDVFANDNSDAVKPVA